MGMSYNQFSQIVYNISVLKVVGSSPRRLTQKDKFSVFVLSLLF